MAIKTWTWQEAFDRAFRHSQFYNTRCRVFKGGSMGWGYIPIYDEVIKK